MNVSRVGANGRISIPSDIRRKFGMKQGTRISFVEQNGKLLVQALDKKYFMSLEGILDTNGRVLKALTDAKDRADNLF